MTPDFDAFESLVSEMKDLTIDDLADKLAKAEAERDALKVRVDGALAILNEQSGNPFGSQYYDNEIEFYEGMRESLQKLLSGKQDRYLKVFERLTGEGES